MNELALQAEGQLLGIVLAACAFFIAVAAFVVERKRVER